MRASIVIAAHDEGGELTRTVASCLETMPSGCELVIADDASGDGSVAETVGCFPEVRVVAHRRRLGASPTKALGADHARGETLVFLDGHTKPDPGSIARLVAAVEATDGVAVITPAVAALQPSSWTVDRLQTGHGYAFDLRRFDCRWLGLEQLRPSAHAGLYESPALIGCAFAISGELYRRCLGFDAGMRSWGVEDLDLGLKAWLHGSPILHDPDAVIGHRFRASFDNYDVPLEHLLVNQLRMARKHFTHGVWEVWLGAMRASLEGQVNGHPEGIWARAWHLFECDRATVERERTHLQAQRVQDEFWYAARFGLPWPQLEGGRPIVSGALRAAAPAP
jgi:GT2 family glycosyltransferase